MEKSIPVEEYKEEKVATIDPVLVSRLSSH
jgi:hypothetical protein